MDASNFEWILDAACRPAHALIIDLPLIAAAGLAVAFWWYQRKKEDDTG